MKYKIIKTKHTNIAHEKSDQHNKHAHEIKL